jgi:hypothetical protein
MEKDHERKEKQNISRRIQIRSILIEQQMELIK